MITLKKFIFAPIFLIAFILLANYVKSLLIPYTFIFSLSPNTVAGLLNFFAIPIILAPLVALASFSFVLFAALALNRKIVISVAVLASIISVFFLEPLYAIILMVGILSGLITIFVFLESGFKTYITFNPNTLLGPIIKNLYILLILIISFIFFLFISKSVPQKGFQLSESFLNESPKSVYSEPQVTNPQIELLKKNPQLLKQFGIDPAIMDSFNPSNQTSTANTLINQAVKDQLQSLLDTLNPYVSFVPALLSILLFLNLFSAFFLLQFLIHFMLWLTFLILEKTGFVRFEIEQRPVKKLVV